MAGEPCREAKTTRFGSGKSAAAASFFACAGIRDGLGAWLFPPMAVGHSPEVTTRLLGCGIWKKERKSAAWKDTPIGSPAWRSPPTAEPPCPAATIRPCVCGGCRKSRRAHDMSLFTHDL